MLHLVSLTSQKPPVIAPQMVPKWSHVNAFLQFRAPMSNQRNILTVVPFLLFKRGNLCKRQPQTVLTAWLVEILPGVLGYHL